MNSAIGDVKSSQVELTDIFTQNIEVKIRTPKRIIHCSDGILEEFSDDEGIVIFNSTLNSTLLIAQN